MFDVECDPAAHPDEKAGPRAYLGVTRVLRDAAIVPPFEVANDILERGSAVHKACDVLDTKPRSFRWTSLRKEYHGYVHAWQLCKETFGIEVLKSEHHVQNKRYMVRGRLDRVAKFRDFKEPYILELCTGPIQQFKALQMAAYGWMLSQDRKLYRRVGIQLRGDGTFAPPKEFPLTRYWQDAMDFLALAQAQHVRARQGL